ncbi:MAG TPA: 7TM-DISM domain-containing protein [Chitinophagales bacterium]|nr:7TM-DISM domain-containing protein [Chitinophagales bacterium]
MTRWIEIFCIALLQCLILFQGNAFSESFDTLIVNDDFKEANLSKYVRYLNDSTNQMELSDYLEATSPTEATLKVNYKNEVYAGYGQNQYWFQFHLLSELSNEKTFFLNFAYPNVDHFIVYQRVEVNGKDSIFQIAEMGDDFLGGNKLLTHRNYIIPVNIQAHQQVDFILQVKKQWEPVNFPLFLTDEYSLVRRTNNDNLFLGVTLGVQLLFSLTLVSLFFFTRNSFFILYLILNIFSIFYLLSDTGIGLQYIWPSIAIIQKVLTYILSIGIILMHITFVRLFFRTSLHLVRFNQFLLALLYMLIGAIVLLVTFVLIFPTSNLPYQIGYIILNSIYLGYGMIILTLCLFTLVQIRRKEIIWITIVVIIQYANWIIQFLVRGTVFPFVLKRFSIYDWNFFPSHISTPHISILLILLEILVVTIILAISFYTFIKDNSSGHYKLLMMSRNTINAYIEGQEKERVKLTERINEGIGQDVEMLGEQIKQTVLQIQDEELKVKLKAISDEVQSIHNEIDKITTDFVPSEYFNKSFYDSVKSIFSPLSTKDIQIKYQLAYPAPFINDFSKVNVCRILQEIVGNISKHSNATLVQVKIYYNKNLIIQVVDDGVGFDMEETKGGIGLINIQSRVKGMNGEIEIEPTKDKGTRIVFKIPLKDLK